MAERKRRDPARPESEERQAALSRWVLALTGVCLVLGLAVTLVSAGTGLDLWPRIYHALGFSAAGAPARAKAGETGVHVVDVGQGDSVLLEQDGHYALIDAGTPACEDDLLNYLDSLGVRQLDLLVMTHPHADHIGSMEAVLQEVQVQQVLLPDFSLIDAAPSFLLERVLEEIARQGIPAVTAAPGQQFDLGGATLHVLAAGVPTDNLNNLSPVLYLDGKTFDFVDTGDGELAVEEAALAAGLPLDAEVFKAGHHGSDTSNTPAFVEAISPRVAVASCGQQNSYGHPSPATLQTFAQAGVQLWRTDQDGTVVILGSKDALRVYTAREGLQEAA